MAHGEGLIHRDIKPANVLFGKGGHLKLGDFGLVRDAGHSRLTRTGVGMGTGLYMAPEQEVDSHSVDGRADLYSVGLVLYEVATGHRLIAPELTPGRNARGDSRRVVGDIDDHGRRASLDNVEPPPGCAT